MSKLVMLIIAAVLLVSAMAKPQVLVDPYYSGYYAATAPAYVASYSAPVAYSYPYAYTYSYPYAYYK